MNAEGREGFLEEVMGKMELTQGRIGEETCQREECVPRSWGRDWLEGVAPVWKEGVYGRSGLKKKKKKY